MSGLSVTDAEVRAAFADAAAWYLDVVASVPDEAWAAPGLGVWTVRELVAHAMRAFTTIETYLDAAPAEVTVADPVTYFRLGMQIQGINDAVAERGRQEGLALGDDPAATVAATAARVVALVDATPDDAICGSVVGGMRLGDYLASRTFELTTHTGDLCAALGIAATPPASSARVTLALIAGLAATGDTAGEAIAALTGRRQWGPGRSVLG